jgi:hypothetical protein
VDYDDSDDEYEEYWYWGGWRSRKWMVMMDGHMLICGRFAWLVVFLWVLGNAYNGGHHDGDSWSLLNPSHNPHWTEVLVLDAMRYSRIDHRSINT